MSLRRITRPGHAQAQPSRSCRPSPTYAIGQSDLAQTARHARSGRHHSPPGMRFVRMITAGISVGACKLQAAPLLCPPSGRSSRPAGARAISGVSTPCQGLGSRVRILRPLQTVAIIKRRGKPGFCRFWGCCRQYFLNAARPAKIGRGYFRVNRFGEAGRIVIARKVALGAGREPLPMPKMAETLNFSQVEGEGDIGVGLRVGVVGGWGGDRRLGLLMQPPWTRAGSTNTLYGSFTRCSQEARPLRYALRAGEIFPQGGGGGGRGGGV